MELLARWFVEKSQFLLSLTALCFLKMRFPHLPGQLLATNSHLDDLLLTEKNERAHVANSRGASA